MTSIADSLALITVLLAALYLLVLAKVALFSPEKAAKFLLGHAASARLHYLELGIRMIVGAAFVVRAHLMKLPEVFTIFGWVIIGTTACLFLIPWQWHRRFTLQAVPYALRSLTLVAIGSFVFSGLIFFCALSGFAS